MAPRGIILLVEDDEDDHVLAREAFSRAEISTRTHMISSGEEAIACLQAHEPFGNRTAYPIPELVLLDLKMPGKSGFDVLAWIRDQTRLPSLPVIVLSSSDAVWVITRAYELRINSFVLKPVDFEDLKILVKTLQCYWLGLDMPPDRASPGEESLSDAPAEASRNDSWTAPPLSYALTANRD